MKITELIRMLEALRKQEGDIDVEWIKCKDATKAVIQPIERGQTGQPSEPRQD